MKIQLISDCHVECDTDGGDAFIYSLDPSICDVLAVCGDFAAYEVLGIALPKLCRRYKDKQILYVPGNHEYWGSSHVATNRLLTDLEALTGNLWILRDHWLTLDSVRFVGSTLWYPRPRHSQWSDFRRIGGHEYQVWDSGAEHSRGLNLGERNAHFLDQEVQEGDVVLTHMLPSTKCVAPMWAGDPNNQFFVHDVTDLIVTRKPKYWLFGHTHNKVDVMIGSTRCLTNPRAYPHERELAQFDPNFVIEV